MTKTNSVVKSTEAVDRPTRVVELKQRGKLEISPVLAAQITELHEAGGTREWSGILVYRALNGDINAPENFHAVAEGFFPMDMGTGAYTEYEPDESIIDIYEHYPKLDPEKNTRQEWRLGQIHTHHNMGAFFSGTDDDELKDNAGKYPFYLSLIVDTKGTYKAKIALIAKQRVKSTETLRWNQGKKWRSFLQKKDEEINVLVTFYLDVKIQTQSWFKERIKIINKTTSKSGYSNHTSTSGQGYGHSQTPSNWREGYRGGEDNSIGFKTGKKDTAPEGSRRMKEKLWARIKSKVGKLIGIEGKVYLGKDEWFHILEFIDINLPGEDARDKHASKVIARFDPWEQENFLVDIHETGLEDGDILSAFIDILNVYKSRNEFVQTLIIQLKAYYDAMYKREDGANVEKEMTQEEKLAAYYQSLDNEE